MLGETLGGSAFITNLTYPKAHLEVLTERGRWLSVVLSILAFTHLAAWSLGTAGHTAGPAIPSHGARVEAAARGTAAAMVATAVAPANNGASALSAAIAPGQGTTTDVSATRTIDIAWLPETLRPWRDELLAAGARWGVDPELLAIVMLVESGGNPAAVSPAGAVGLMQVMPATAADIARLRGLPAPGVVELAVPATNIDFGAWYLARQLASFGSADDPDWQRSVELAAVAYNGGPGSAAASLRGGFVPAEARRYRVWVGGMWSERGAASSATFERWLSAGGGYLVDRARAVLTQGGGDFGWVTG